MGHIDRELVDQFVLDKRREYCRAFALWRKAECPHGQARLWKEIEMLKAEIRVIPFIEKAIRASSSGSFLSVYEGILMILDGGKCHEVSLRQEAANYGLIDP